MRETINRIIISSNEEDDEVLENFLDPLQLKEFLRSSEENLRMTGFIGILLLAYSGLRNGVKVG
jgi:hypothetical protein